MRSAIYSRLEQRVVKLKLSILICTLPERLTTLEELVLDLNHQIGAGPVEFKYLGDNKRQSVGAKRNDLLSMAHGEWVCFVDDDDFLNSGFVRIILDAINNNPDKKVICFGGSRSTNGHKDLDFKFNKSYGRNMRIVTEGPEFRGMVPNHLCVWKTALAQRHKFDNINLSEDHRWATAMMDEYDEGDQVILTEKLYHYEFNKATSQCRRG